MEQGQHVVGRAGGDCFLRFNNRPAIKEGGDAKFTDFDRRGALRREPVDFPAGEAVRNRKILARGGFARTGASFCSSSVFVLVGGGCGSLTFSIPKAISMGTVPSSAL